MAHYFQNPSTLGTEANTSLSPTKENRYMCKNNYNNNVNNINHNIKQHVVTEKRKYI